MYKPKSLRRRGVNFRLSTVELEKIDKLARHLENEGDLNFWPNTWSRTKVIRYLVDWKIAEIETEARRKFDAEINSKKTKTSIAKAKKRSDGK